MFQSIYFIELYSIIVYLISSRVLLHRGKGGLNALQLKTIFVHIYNDNHRFSGHGS